jgi:hypothetical protein
MSDGVNPRGDAATAATEVPDTIRHRVDREMVPLYTALTKALRLGALRASLWPSCVIVTVSTSVGVLCSRRCRRR